MPNIRTYYGHAESEGYVSENPSVTQQQFKDEADINYIVRMYDAQGVIPGQTGAAPREPMFGDFSNLPENAQEAYNQILEAKSNFNNLDVEIRKRFNFDPAAFFEFVQNPANVDELVSLGLAVRTSAPVEGTGEMQNNTDNVNNDAHSGQPTT